jgi:two-component system response regulator TctD
MKLLLIEDNAELSSWLSRLLGQSGYAVELAHDGGQALHLLRTQVYDAILLDLTLPDMQGQDILTRLRRNHDNVPVLVISAQGSLDTIVAHLNLGADDYLAKPFDIQELEARLRSLLRRASGKPAPQITCGALSYDTNAKQFRSHGTLIGLTPREHAVLEALMRQSGKTVSKTALADQLFTLEDTVSAKAIEVYIVRLRKKIEQSGAQIITLRGLGYMLSYVASSRA